MKEDFKRLLQAAYELRGLVSAAEVANALTLGGFRASDQTMTNWKTRGISAAGRLAASRIIGCRTRYLELGEFPIADTSAKSSATDPAAKIYEIAKSLPAERQARLLHYLEVSLEIESQKDLAKDQPPEASQRTG